jgi:uncharacterized damage-inducible protein DinB
MTNRVDPPNAAEERPMLVAWLEYHRATLALKCDGLADEQLRTRAVPPSTLSLLGLVRHMADVERTWFRGSLMGEVAAPHYWSDESPDGDFDEVDHADVAADLATWQAEWDAARAIVEATPSLDELERRQGRPGGPVSLRWILVHMIEEYARHNGHADLLREQLDGAVGE